MTNEAREIEEKALSLSAAEREALANHLFQSVHNQEQNGNDQAWLALAEERLRKLSSLKSEIQIGLEQLRAGKSKKMDDSFIASVKKRGRERLNG